MALRIGGPFFLGPVRPAPGARDSSARRTRLARSTVQPGGGVARGGFEPATYGLEKPLLSPLSYRPEWGCVPPSADGGPALSSRVVAPAIVLAIPCAWARSRPPPSRASAPSAKLALDGSLRPVPGGLRDGRGAAARQGWRRLVVPRATPPRPRSSTAPAARGDGQRAVPRAPAAGVRRKPVFLRLRRRPGAPLRLPARPGRGLPGAAVGSGARPLLQAGLRKGHRSRRLRG